jgi:subfamily B ATP-binding cassette protein HlyB/CyaB
LETSSPEQKIDTGLLCLTMLSRVHGLPADPAQLHHQFGESGKFFTSSEILRAAKSLGLKAREVKSDWSKLSKTQLPAIAIQILPFE